jgi:Tol biopolymer transport system component
LVLVSIGLGWVSARQFSPAPGRREVRFEIETPTTVERQAIALSPDGTQLVFVANAAGQRRLLIRALGSTSTRVLERSDDARYPFWSADGKSIGFFAQGKLKALDISSGTVRSLAEAPRGLGGTWNQTGIIVFAPTFGGPLQQVSAAGGPISPASRMSRSVVRQASPRFLPDGKHFLFYADGDDQERGVYVGQLDSMDATRVVTDADAAAVFLPPHALVYPRAGALVARHFDPIDRRVSGEPIQIAESVYFDPLQSASALSAATDGTLAFRPRSDAGLGVRLSWFDRSGREIERADSRTDAAANAFALSPDRQRVAIGRSQQRGIWLLDIARGIVEPFVRFGNQPVWARDGKRLAFAASKTSRFLDLYVASLDGNGSDELLLSTPQTKTASDWSPDGASLLFRSIDPVTRSDLWMLPLSGNRTPVLVLKTDADERDAMFSPDGRWIAYESDRTGRPEISLQPFGRPGPTMQISSGGGLQARWRGDGRELFYVREDDGRLMAVAVDNLASDNPVAHPPTALFTAPLAIGGPGLQQYTASPDGQRFLINVIRDRAAEAITVILNWQEELKQRVPTR